MPSDGHAHQASPGPTAALLASVRDGRLSDQAGETLVSAALTDTRRAFANLRSVAARAETAFPALLPLALSSLSASPDADMALNNVDRILAAQDDAPALVREWMDRPEGLDVVMQLSACSQLLADILRDCCLEFCAGLAQVRAPERLPRDALARQVIDGATAPQDERSRMDALRRLKNRHLVDIAARDILQVASFGVLVEEISDLAAACVQAALEITRGAVEPPALEGYLGAPPEWWRAFAVIAMGKLGGHELNYSSDVDLLFVCDAPWCGGDTLPDPVRRYFTRLSQKLVEVIGGITIDGGLLRVDLRLRPEGGAGALFRTLGSYATYYESWGEVWERQALIKASWLAGDRELAERFVAMAQEFVYGSHLETGGVAEIKAVKDRIEASAQRAGKGRNVKLGPGCIRDIEFTVQLLQLVLGTQDPDVRKKSTLGALRALGAGRYLTATEHRTLASSYVFLRTVEHQLQLMHGLGTRELPEEQEALEKLACRLGMDPVPEMSPGTYLISEFNRHTGETRVLFQKLFSEMFEARSDVDVRARSLVLLPDDPDPGDMAVLAQYGIRDLAPAADALRRLAGGTVRAPSPPSVAEQFAELAPVVLQAAADTPDPDASIANFERFCGLIGSHRALYSLLAEDARVVNMLVRVAGCSASLSAILVRHPEYFDMLMDPGLMEVVRDREVMGGEMRIRVDELRDPAARIQAVSRFRRRELLRIGVRDLMDGADTETTIRELATLGEVCLEGLLDIACETVTGVPSAPPFAVMGMGKLAGRELHYNSDLDIVFVWDGDAGSQPLFTRLAGEVLAAADRAAPGEGPPLALDARLRPEGQSGPLVRSVDACAEYYTRRAATWERLALIRCRAVAGDETVGAAFLEAVEPFVWGEGLSAEELEEIIHIKARIERERARSAPNVIDVKLGPGGINDVEFAVQLLQLAHGHADRSIRTPGTLSGLRALAAAGLVAGEEAALLEEAYVLLRRVECRLQVVHDWDESSIEPGSGGFEALASLLQYLDVSGMGGADRLAEDLERNRGRVRAFWEGTVRRLQ